MSLIYPLFIPMAGCAARCIYCDQSKLSGASALDLEQAAHDVAAFIRHHPEQDKQIAFYGGSFTRLSPQERNTMLERILPLLDEHSSFRISTHPLWIDQEILDWCGQNRIRTIELGIQDFNEAVLHRSGRGYGTAEAVGACKAVQEAGFELGIQLMPGLPGADLSSLEANLYYLRELKPRFLRLYPLIVIKGTPLEEEFRQGRYQPLSLDAAIQICADYCLLAESLRIRVIKLGIPSNIASEDILAGPYHPAFGEFVKAELLIRKLELDYQPDQPIFLNRKQASLLHGHGGRYFKILQDRLKNCTLKLEITDNHS
ncbi:MAG TPA: radical SAM protein [Candidatus Cloacimonadota bacterium]|nr:radical SAM protein [Candidatus Cloacimonadota bacterium]